MSLFYDTSVALGEISTVLGYTLVQFPPQTDASRPALGLMTSLTIKYRGVTLSATV